MYSHIFTVYSNHIPLHTKYILYLEWMPAEWETYIFIYLLSLCKWLECTKFLFSLAAVWGDWMELCYILCFFCILCWVLAVYFSSLLTVGSAGKWKGHCWSDLWCDKYSTKLHPPTKHFANKQRIVSKSSVAVHASAVFLCHSACKVISCWTLCCLANVLVTFW